MPVMILLAIMNLNEILLAITNDIIDFTSDIYFQNWHVIIMFPKDKNGRLLGNNMHSYAQFISFPNYRVRNMLELEKGAKFPLK